MPEIRREGKATECKMLYARAKTISIPKFQMKATNSYGKRYRDRRYKETSLLFEASNNMSAATKEEEEEEEEALECIAIELVADRFLRKMVRCIVSTACRELPCSQILIKQKRSTKTFFSNSLEMEIEWLWRHRRRRMVCCFAVLGTVTHTNFSSRKNDHFRTDYYV